LSQAIESDTPYQSYLSSLNSSLSRAIIDLYDDVKTKSTALVSFRHRDLSVVLRDSVGKEDKGTEMGRHVGGKWKEKVEGTKEDRRRGRGGVTPGWENVKYPFPSLLFSKDD
jgi:hypothetical protein